MQMNWRSGGVWVWRLWRFVAVCGRMDERLRERDGASLCTAAMCEAQLL